MYIWVLIVCYQNKYKITVTLPLRNHKIISLTTLYSFARFCNKNKFRYVEKCKVTKIPLGDSICLCYLLPHKARGKCCSNLYLQATVRITKRFKKGLSWFFKNLRKLELFMSFAHSYHTVFFFFFCICKHQSYGRTLLIPVKLLLSLSNMNVNNLEFLKKKQTKTLHYI